MNSKLKINGHQFELFLERNQIEDRIAEMAAEFNREYTGGKTMVPVMVGAFYFASRFLQFIDKPYYLINVQSSSYEGVNQADKMVFSFMKDEKLIQDAQLVILEDIVDSGRTAHELEKYFYSLGAAKVEVVSLFYKPEHQRYDCNVTHYGFEVENKFIVGYGLDFYEEGRYLKDAWQLKVDD